VKYVQYIATLAVVSTLGFATTYENAEQSSTHNWRVIDNKPYGACITNVYDSEKASNVIEFNGDGTHNAYLIGSKHRHSFKAWHNKDERVLSWSMKFSEPYKLTLFVKTKRGSRKIYFTPGDQSFRKHHHNIVIGLKSDSMNGEWKTFSYDIDKLLKEYEPHNKVISISGLRVRGSGRVDDIKLSPTGGNGGSLSKVDLGKALYFDKSLSFNRTMSCATCHAPSKGFIDERESPIGHAAALSADNDFIATRNVPTNSYAAFTPEFKSVLKDNSTDVIYIGGQFLDGRAKDLKAQAKGPFLNPVEMQMPSKSAVIDRVKEKPLYIKSLREIYGDNIFANVDESYDAIADAIATFEKTDLFSPFDSKYDRMLKGQYLFTAQEQEGLAIFTDLNRGKCAKCHSLVNGDAKAGLFTNYKYHNLGVSKNLDLLAANGKGSAFVDHGLLENPNVDDESMDGKFRISTLRNVAVTSPYMHNGIFKDLKTVVHFYNTRDVAGAINPETGKAWGEPEIPNTVNHKLLGDLKLTDEEENALVAFMKTLTDKRYENMIPNNGGNGGNGGNDNHEGDHEHGEHHNHGHHNHHEHGEHHNHGHHNHHEHGEHHNHGHHNHVYQGGICGHNRHEHSEHQGHHNNGGFNPWKDFFARF